MINLRWRLAQWLLNDPAAKAKLQERVTAAIAKEGARIGARAEAYAKQPRPLLERLTEDQQKRNPPLYAICDVCFCYRLTVARKVTEYVGTMLSTEGNREMSATRFLRVCLDCAEDFDRDGAEAQEGAA